MKAVYTGFAAQVMHQAARSQTVGGRMDSGEIGETLQVFRNPGEQLRGIIYVARGGSPPIVVEACPAVTVEFDEQEQVYVAVCDCFGVVGTARDEAGAVRELETTLRVFLSELLDNDCLHETLSKKGWMATSIPKSDMLQQVRDAVGVDSSFHISHIVLSSISDGVSVG